MTDEPPSECACGAVDLAAVADRVWVDSDFVVHRPSWCGDADGCPNDVE